MSRLDGHLTTLDDFAELVTFAQKNERQVYSLSATLDKYQRLYGVEISKELRPSIHKRVADYLKPVRDLLLSGDDDVWAKIKDYSAANAVPLFDDFCKLGLERRVAGKVTIEAARIFHQRPKPLLLYSSLLVATIGASEVFLGELMKEFLRARPQALSGTEFRVPFAELGIYDSIEDFKNQQIDRQVESIIRQGGVEEWMKWFEDKLRIQRTNLSHDFIATKEVFQRRHLHVHNGGRVSSLYLQKMADAESLPSVGNYLRVTPDYLERSIDLLRELAITLTGSICQKLLRRTDDLNEAMEGLANVIYDYLGQGRYALLINLVPLLQNEKMQADTRLRMQVNAWIARYQTEDATLRKEVEAWDTSALSPKYMLAKQVLLGKFEEAQEEALKQIDQGYLSREGYETWPLFMPLRERFPGALPAESDPEVTAEAVRVAVEDQPDSPDV